MLLWIEFLHAYQFTLQHHMGIEKIKADFLSLLPVEAIESDPHSSSRTTHDEMLTASPVY